VDNQVRLQLFALAYNQGNFLRRLALPKSLKDWSLRTPRDKLIKIGAKVVCRSRHVVFQMAEVAAVAEALPGKPRPHRAVESWPRVDGSRMRSYGAKAGLGNEKTAAEVRQKSGAVPERQNDRF